MKLKNMMTHLTSNVINHNIKIINKMNIIHKDISKPLTDEIISQIISNGENFRLDGYWTIIKYMELKDEELFDKIIIEYGVDKIRIPIEFYKLKALLISIKRAEKLRLLGL